MEEDWLISATTSSSMWENVHFYLFLEGSTKVLKPTYFTVVQCARAQPLGVVVETAIEEALSYVTGRNGS